MGDDMISRLNTMDIDILTDVVRQDQQSASFEIKEWSVRRLSDKGIINPDGLWLFSGLGHDGEGTRSWSVVLKYFSRPEHEQPQDHIWYWKREALLAQSGLLERMPGPVRAPRFYRTDEFPDSVWLWIEHIQDERPGLWTLDQYSFVTFQLGRWNGACLAEIPLVEEPWLARRHYVSWLEWLRVEEDWQFRLNQAHVSAELRRRYDQLWAEREVFYKVLEELPQVFSHFDSQRRNLFICSDTEGTDQLVAVDWAQCGLGPLGAELNGSVADNGIMLQWSPAELSKLDAVAFPSYVQGLHQARWMGDVDLVRLGYVAWRAVYYGLIFPAYTAVWCSPEQAPFASQIYGLAEEELFWKLLPLLEFSLDGADDARGLMKKTNMI